MQKFKKYIIVFALITVVLIVFFLIWNKPHINIQKAKADYTVTSAQLYSDFVTDEKKAMNKYSKSDETILIVTGKLIDIEKDFDNRDILILETGDPTGKVRCNMEKSDKNLSIGQTIKIKGQCSGYVSDVILNRCYLLK